MKKISSPITVLSLFLVLLQACSQEGKESAYQPAESPLYTRWTHQVDPVCPWPEYPRPQMVREEWINLNGLWELAIAPVDSTPVHFDRKILVPYPVESALSGIGERVTEQQAIWYRREAEVSAGWDGQRILLHFEASDWKTTLWVNGEQVGVHHGGYDPFVFDVTEFIKAGEANTFTVSVWDPTDTGYQPRGKQVGNPRGIWYTPSSGIWQTVWMEPVHESHLENFFLTTDIDRGTVHITPQITAIDKLSGIEVAVFSNGQEVVTRSFEPGEEIGFALDHPEFWTPDNPFLYDMTIRLVDGDTTVDEVDTYFGIRKISLKKDEQGYNRLALNNQILFHNGPLDQGFWPDGLNTPPTEEAMRHDLEMTKAMGFNMLRKHVKVENRRFYQMCDRMGLMVWQDMPSAAGFIAPDGDDLQPTGEHRSQFEYELERLVLTHYNHPSIVMWVPFNEGWGQYDTERIVALVKGMDSTRLVNNASGWTDRRVGDVIDIHHYPDPRCPGPEPERASVLGEFGGLGLYVEGHAWQKENWGYEQFTSVGDLMLKYEDFYREVERMKTECGLAAAVYTQTTDVETETNGLMTYDRHMVKMGVENIRKAHLGVIPPRIGTPLRGFIDSLTLELHTPGPLATPQYSLSRPGSPDQWMDYLGALTISSPVTLKTRAIWPDGRISREGADNFVKLTPYPSMYHEVVPGLRVSYFRGNWDKLPDFSAMEPEKQGVAAKPDLAFADTTQLFGMVFEGYLEVPETEVYLIHLSSDDGARLYLNGEERIDYDGIHGAGIRKATLALEQGLHPFRLVYFQRYGGLGLSIHWESQRMPYQEIAPEYWKH